MTTPRPWQLSTIEGTNKIMLGGDEDGSDIIADIREDRIEDAEFLVRAVNSHDELVEALESAYEILTDLTLNDYHENKRRNESVDEIKAALTKAKGDQ